MKKTIKLFVLIAILAIDGFLAHAQTPGCGRTYTLDADFYEGNLLSVNTSIPDQLQLDQPGRPLPYINIACSGKGTVVRIDITTGEVIGEYLTAPSGMGANPSRTTVDKYGNVWVTNRNEDGISGGVSKGSVTRIGITIGGIRCDASGNPDSTGQYLKPPFFYNTCIDKNGDGLIKTSRALGNVLTWSNAGGVDANGGVSTADDEAIITYTRVRATGARTVAVDEFNNVWVGGSSNRWHEKLNGNTGQPVPGTQFNLGVGGYGGFIDNNGVLWSAGAPSGNPLLRYNTINGNAVSLTGRGDYGLGVDPITGEVWHTRYEGNTIYKLDSAGNVLGTYSHGNFASQGCAVDAIGNVWVAHSTGSNSVGHLRTDGTYIGNIVLPSGGDGPTGLAVDANGKIWVTCYNSHQAMRIDPAAGPIINGYPLGAVDLVVYLGNGAFPYNYSDMTGYVVINATVPSGTWTVIHDSQRSGNKWGRMSWTDSIPAGTGIRVEARASDNQLTLASYPFVEVTKGESFCCSGVTGRYVEIRVTLFRQQTVNISPILYDLTIECCDVYPNTPPTIASSRGCNQDTIRVAAGQPVSFSITGNDVDTAQMVTITSTELPVGATMTPALPAVGNPSQTVFSWTTDFSQVGVYNFTFEANDTYCYSASCPTIVEVVPCPTIQCSGAGVSCVGLCNGRAEVSISGNPTNFTYTWNTSPSQTTQSIANLCPGVYQVVTYDGFACLDSCSIVIPSDACAGFQSFTQGGWGAPPRGKNVASYLRTRFATVFPSGLTIGCTNKLKLTSSTAVVDFLPSGSTARALPGGMLTNPGQSYQNVLAGQLVAATLNVKMDSAYSNFAPATGTLGNLIIANGPFGGWTVNELIDEANRAIGGCGSSFGFSTLNNALDLINNNYNNGEFFSTTVNRCFLSCPVLGSTGTLRLANSGRAINDVEELELFPNPARENVTLRFNSRTDCKIAVDLLGLNGELVRTVVNKEVYGGESVEETFDIKDLTPGVYVVRFNDGTQSILRRIAVVK